MSALSAALIRSGIARQFLSFAAVGAVGTGVHYATLVVGVQLTLDPVAASALGWSLGAVANYTLNYHLTFRSRLAHRHIVPRFALIAAIGLLLNTLLMAVEVNWLGLHYLVAQFVTTGALLCWNFVMSRIWAFKTTPRNVASGRLVVTTQAASQTGARPLLRYLKGAVVLWAGAVLVVVGSVGFVTSVRDWRASQTVERDAVETRATIAGKSIAAPSGGRGSSTHYLALYSFTTNDGTRLEGSEELPLETWERVSERGFLAIRDLPADLVDARALPDDPRWVWPLLTGISAAFAVLGVLLARPSVRRLQTIRRVLRTGVDARATVIDVAPTYTRDDRASRWRVRYEFADALGRTHAGNSEPISPQEAAGWNLGDGVAVRFDPHAPHHHCWLGTRVP
ncbi:MAG TPA: GtrA family protein [Gammaproteobacteria bacterium]|nr:GtrA family protein [Gammaproteobacteria bacterium]